MGLLDDFSQFVKTPEGMGLLSAVAGGLAGANRGTPINNLGRAGLAGVMGYGNALDRQERTAENAVQNQLRQAQMAEFARKQKIVEAQQAWLQSNPNAPEEVKAGVVPFEKWWERQNPKVEPYTLTPGSKRYGADNSVVAEVPIERKLPEGMQLDNQGNLVEIPGYVSMKQKIAAAGRAPAQPAQPYYSPVVDATRGVGTFDHRSGQMKWDQPTPVIKPADSPELQGKIAEAEKLGAETGKQKSLMQGKEDALASVKEANKMLNQGIYSGAYANLKMKGAKYTPGVSTDTAARTEEFMAYIGNTVVPRLQEFGGNDSNEELRYLRGIMGGEITMEEKALKKILADSERKIQAGINRLKMQPKGRQDNNDPLGLR